MWVALPTASPATASCVSFSFQLSATPGWAPTTGEAACDLACGDYSGLLSNARILATSFAGLANSHSSLGLPLLASPVVLTFLEPGLSLSLEVGVLEAETRVTGSPYYRPMNIVASLCPLFGVLSLAQTGVRESSEQSGEWTLTQGPACPGVCSAGPGFWEAA